MPPIVRQVYDRHVSDFRLSPLDWAIDSAKQSVSSTERVQAYVYEPDRKAAIGYFNLKLSRSGQQPHVASLTVHPAYTRLYPDLMAQMAQLTQVYPAQSLSLASTDYQPEREEFLLKLGAEDIERTLIMSRSVWPKLRESRMSLVNLQLNNMLRSLQVNQPVPERIEVGCGDGYTPFDFETWADRYTWLIQGDNSEERPRRISGDQQSY
jgi:predicted transcriptional regulator